MSKAAPDKPTTGRCHCGYIRYQLRRAPTRSHLCFCSDCQHQSGGMGSHITPMALDDFELLEGELGIYHSTAASGRSIERGFCPRCSSRIYGAVRELGVVGINVSSLECAQTLAPQAAMYLSHAPAWLSLPEDIARFDEMPPM